MGLIHTRPWPTSPTAGSVIEFELSTRFPADGADLQKSESAAAQVSGWEDRCVGGDRLCLPDWPIFFPDANQLHSVILSYIKSHSVFPSNWAGWLNIQDRWHPHVPHAPAYGHVPHDI